MEQEDLEKILGVKLEYFENNNFKLSTGNNYYNIVAIEKEYKPDAYQLKINFEKTK